MQLYQGLPIITNKITQDEMKGVPHHLLGQIGLQEETWTVGRFVENALGVIKEIRSRGKLPILVGGTHYYTQSLLFEDALADQPTLEESSMSGGFPILNEPNEVILEKLREVDPIMADRWHANDRRKIQRSLEIYLKTGKPASQVYSEQRLNREPLSNPDDSEAMMNSSAPGIRFSTLLFWVHASKDVLNARLESRTVKMLERGLLKEVETLTEFRNDFEAKTGQAVDQTRGIWVSIGYKEFLGYQAALTTGKSEADLDKLRLAAIEKTQAATRQYAKRQLRWIRIKLLNALFQAGQRDRLFLLDGSDLSNWEETVWEPARDITKKFLGGEQLPVPTDLSPLASEMLIPKRDYDLSQRPDLWQRRVCETCGTIAVNENDWRLHINSRGHRRALGKVKKEEEKRGKSRSAQADLIDVLETYQKILSEDEPVT
ncbi:IPPT-domain-containing protein [Westerdykella ornata]|uniref:IPPT-domain-containing protein n=1 Tax=Westerdykella ornata TaxID=318751 RepID=A0A6A6JQ67_WESOR|nr:IPPT-domain-containing protein [Westerdykella ornata]KAF2278682.1 IPPT-domain-containing protein [Westerdykella ornata]